MVLVDKSIFIEKMGDSPQTKILDFLLTFREFDYSGTDIAKEADVSWITAKKIIENLHKQSILKETRKVGKSVMYKLNTKNVFVKDLISLYDGLIKSKLEVEQEKVVA